MADLIVRRIERSVLEELKDRAARHRISVNEEHRRILQAALGLKPKHKNSCLNLPWTAPDLGD
jgi:plasmid stability protein